MSSIKPKQKRHSCGIILYKKSRKNNRVKIFLVKSNSPILWKTKRENIWGMPKGGMEEGETPLETALREFHEEVGVEAPDLEYKELVTFEEKQRILTAFIAKANGEHITFNHSLTKHLEVEGRIINYPEIAGGEWFYLDEALAYKIMPSQARLFRYFAKQLKKKLI